MLYKQWEGTGFRKPVPSFFNPGRGAADRGRRPGQLALAMLIKKHDKSRIVELEDGALWRISPRDLALTLNWLPTTDLRVSEIADEFCSHALIDQTDGSRVRNWPVEQVRQSMKKG